MLHSTLSLGAAVLALLSAGACASAARIELRPGDPAPDFALTGSDGKVHRLSDDVGKRAVVLAWFPKAFTSG
jgi:thioredoxin-dependent peroxiredoxin